MSGLVKIRRLGRLLINRFAPRASIERERIEAVSASSYRAPLSERRVFGEADSSTNRLRQKMQARLDSDLEDDGFEMWRGKGISFAFASLKDWEDDCPGRSAAGFFDWASDLSGLALWDELSSETRKSSGFRGWGIGSYLASFHDYQRGAPLSSSAQSFHGVVVMSIFPQGPERRRCVETLCDMPEALAKARLGLAKDFWPSSEEEALRVLSSIEAFELEAALAARPDPARRSSVCRV